MSKIILIVGPTGVGKTALSISLAHYLNAEIINADSTQVYTEPLIATAKITEEEKEQIPHHMMNIVSLNEEFTLYDYQKQTRKILNDLINQNKNIIIVGGSGLYVKALLYDYNLEENKLPQKDLSNYSNQELKSIADSISKNDIHVNNRQRLEGFINHYYSNGTILEKTNNINNLLYDVDVIGLTTDRETLYNMLNNRVDKMLKNGLLDEATTLYKKKYKKYSSIIGYKELIPYFNNEISLTEAIENIKKDTRHYAKRQYTWWNNQMNNIKWFTTNYNDFNKTIDEVKEYLNNK